MGGAGGGAVRTPIGQRGRRVGGSAARIGGRRRVGPCDWQAAAAAARRPPSGLFCSRPGRPVAAAAAAGSDRDRPCPLPPPSAAAAGPGARPPEGGGGAGPGNVAAAVSPPPRPGRHGAAAVTAPYLSAPPGAGPTPAKMGESRGGGLNGPRCLGGALTGLRRRGRAAAGPLGAEAGRGRGVSVCGLRGSGHDGAGCPRRLRSAGVVTSVGSGAVGSAETAWANRVYS